MSITGSLVIYMILWWLILFLILPRNISSQEETENVIKGTDPGAPVNSNIKKKLILTTIITTIIFAIIYCLAYFDILNIRRIMS